MTGRLDEGRGNEADYRFGSREGWDAFDVVRWHAVEELSCPYHYEITLRRAAERGPVDLDALLDSGATFRIASAQRWRTVHGILAEAEEIDRTRALFYYRLLLVPPLARLRHRAHCRTFSGRTLKDIVSCVLEHRDYPGAASLAGLLPHSGDLGPAAAAPDFQRFDEPHGRYAWRVSDERRITHKHLYRFVAQYNESDFDFISRLLEQEGITYSFEHALDSVVMVLTDAPGQSAPHETDRKALLRGEAPAGTHAGQEVVYRLRDARRLRPRAVTVREYDFLRSKQLFDSRAEGGDRLADGSGHFEHGGKDEALDDKLGAFPAELRRARFEVERHLRGGTSTVRTLLPGYALALTDGDGLRDDQDLLLVRTETFATQHGMDGSAAAREPFGLDAAGQEPGSYENRFEALPISVRFCPERRVPRARIWGVQTARVWGPDASPGAGATAAPVDIHCDEHGRVRVQLVWDTRACRDGQPPSHWCRVAQPWAGNGYGTMHVPRVGHEVLISYENGDPDRPVIVGSVYNHPDCPPPYDPSDAKNKTRTTLKTRSSSATCAEEGYNELRLTDYKGAEEIFLHAQKDLNEVVENSHATSVGGDQANSVGNDRSHDVTGRESVHVHGDRSTRFDANETHTVGGFLTTRVGANEDHGAAGFRKTDIGANDDLHVAGWRNTNVGSGENRTVDGPDGVTVSADRRVSVGANHHLRAGANHTIDSTNMYVTQAGEFQVNATSLWLNVGGASLRMSAGVVAIDNGAGASVLLLSSHVLVTSAATLVVSGGPIGLTAAGDIHAAAAAIHLNG